MKAKFLLSGMLGLIGCGGLDTFPIEVTSESQVEGGSLIEQWVGDLGFGGFLNLDISSHESLANQGIKPEQIDSVRLTEMRLEITSPDAQDFTFIESLEFLAEAPELEQKLVAFGGPFTEGESIIILDRTDLELAPYATAETMSITTNVTGRRPPQDTTIKAFLRLDVDVNVTGLLSSL
ncbi:MAG: hypothetical protein VX405_11390 [Myxococcota bacterium]|jgi:hypothetical protein|nr:hypothetical protein [Myxococcales bacterium]MEC7752097.1 hypothetical protein [Myxococcota bacterium]